MFSEGTLVAGKYRVDRILGRGGMGVVASATHVHLHQRVALKFLQPSYENNKHVIERFVREARASGALRGEHVCRVSDVGALDNGTPYIVMELLEGQDLSTLIKTTGPQPVQRACDYVLQACVGVSEAHSLGIVHRDLKPANLFLSRRPDGTPLIKVLDFGIAKASNEDFSITKTTSILGSPGYMSPEQLKSSRDVDLRTDIWSLGVILYELVAGRPPFTAESITELAIRVTMDQRAAFVNRMPNGFDQVIDRCLAKDPAQRYPDLANLAHALAAHAGPNGWELANSVSRMLHVVPQPQEVVMIGGGVAATVPPTGFAAPPTVPPTSYVLPTAHGGTQAPTTLGSSASSIDGHRPRSQYRWGVIAGVAAAIIACAVTYAVLTTSDKPPVAVTQPSPPPPTPEPVVEVDAAAAVAEPTISVDAAINAAPADAGTVAEPTPDAAVKKPGGKKPPTNRPPEDFGESRF